MGNLEKMRGCMKFNDCKIQLDLPSPATAARIEPLESRQMLSVSQDASGWTQVSPSVDTRVVYVSSSGGDDANGGLSPDAPVRTIGRGTSLLRDGMPDWLLLKRGDTFTSGFDGWTKSGRSTQEPVLIAAYGPATDPRPLLKTGDQSGLNTSGDANYVTIIGLHFYAHTRDPDAPEFAGPGAAGDIAAVRWLAPSDGLHVEDSVFEFYKTNVIVQRYSGPISNVTLRRNVIRDAYSTDSHSQGLYADAVDGLLVEENVFDHNGWNERVAGARATMFNHNLYLNSGSSGIVVRGNVIANAAAIGIKAASGGDVRDNLFLRNPIHLSYGFATVIHPGGVHGEISGNVFTGSRDIDGAPRGAAINIGNLTPGLGATVRDNVITDDEGQFTAAIQFQETGVGVNDLLVERNVVHKWYGGLWISPKVGWGGTGGGALHDIAVRGNVFQDTRSFLVYHPQPFAPAEEAWSDDRYHHAGVNPDAWFQTGNDTLSLAEWQQAVEPTASPGPLAFPDPDRNAATYNASRGGPATLDAFLAQARLQSHADWRDPYTANAVIQYVRAGFGLAPISQIVVTAVGASQTTEAGGSASYQVVLNRQPSSNVTIPVSSSNSSEGTVSVSSLVFTPDDWNVAQLITMVGVDDAAVDGNQNYKLVLGAAQSTDTGFMGLDAPDVTLVNLNDDLDTTSPDLAMNHGGSIKMIRSSSVMQTVGYDFTVLYSDDGGVDTDSLKTGNLQIIGPGGYNQLPAFVSSTVQADGTVVATYRFNPPAGTWDKADNAIYRLGAGPTPAADNAGNLAVTGNAGTLIVYITTEPEQPLMSVALAANAVTTKTVLETSSSAYTFQVTYLPDDFEMKAGTIGDGDIKVVNNLGYQATAKIVSRKRGRTPGSMVAKYRIVPPGGSWNSSDNTVYAVTLLNREVRDVEGHYVPGGKLGKFRVNLLPSGGGVVITPEAMAPPEPLRDGPGYTSATEDLFNSRTRIFDLA
jgi:hypothetical protein